MVVTRRALLFGVLGIPGCLRLQEPDNAADASAVLPFREDFADGSLDRWDVVWLPETTGGPRDIKNDWIVTEANAIDGNFSLRLHSESDRNAIATTDRVLDMTQDFRLSMQFMTPDPNNRGPRIRSLDREENQLNQDHGYSRDDMSDMFADDAIAVSFDSGAIADAGDPFDGELTFCGETTDRPSYAADQIHTVEIETIGSDATLWVNDDELLTASVATDGAYRLLLESSGTYGMPSTIYFDAIEVVPI